MKIHRVDYRDQEVDSLVTLLQRKLEEYPTTPIWWTARRPKKRWYLKVSERSALNFTTAPQFEQLLWLPENCAPLTHAESSTESQKLLQDYHPLFEGTEPLESCPRWKTYRERLLSHISRQEKHDYPHLLDALPAERGIRELGYEHRGLEKGLERLPSLISSSRRGELDKKDKERIDLDYYHLLEHHLEREQEAIYPAILFFQEG